jgi:hypothetical protein
MKQSIISNLRHLYKLGLLLALLLLFVYPASESSLAQSFPTFTPTPGPATNTPPPPPTNTRPPQQPTNTPSAQQPTNTPSAQQSTSTATPAPVTTQTATPTPTVPGATPGTTDTAAGPPPTADPCCTATPTATIDAADDETADTSADIDEAGVDRAAIGSTATPAPLATDPAGSSDWLPIVGIVLIIAGIAAAYLLRRQ